MAPESQDAVDAQHPQRGDLEALSKVIQAIGRLPRLPVHDWCERAARAVRAGLASSAQIVAVHGPRQASSPQVGTVVAEGLGCSASDVVGAVWRNSWEFPRAHAPVALCDEASLGTRVFREAGLPPGRAVHARRALSTESSLHVLVWRDPRVAAPERELSVLDLATEALARIAQPFIAEHASWFTPRETEVLDLLVQGRTVAEIARHIHRSPHTVQDHIKSMHNKANVSTRGGLVAAACGVESVEPVSPRRGDN